MISNRTLQLVLVGHWRNSFETQIQNHFRIASIRDSDRNCLLFCFPRPVLHPEKRRLESIKCELSAYRKSGLEKRKSLSGKRRR